ncbi:hypothetical protein [Natronobiforma cellulositropha]|uniref:hypothetical protein n=1 Tax=Natronobiforma cellulositropha TaxID=1679076 RepID=UPI0021D5E519|nr:hypothetical protein [Natronobiforma cellulositropha]
MSDVPERPLPRRAFLAATAVPALAGCIVDYGSCTTGGLPFETDAVESFVISSATGAAADGGPCDDDTGRCLHVHLEVDPDEIGLIEVQTPDGEVVRTQDVDERNVTNFEVSAGDRTDRQERTIVLRDEDGGAVDTTDVHTRCRV